VTLIDQRTPRHVGLSCEYPTAKGNDGPRITKEIYDISIMEIEKQNKDEALLDQTIFKMY